MKISRKIIIISVLFSFPYNQADDISEACGKDAYQRIRIMDKGDIFSPGYQEGKNYPLQIKCSYYLYTKPGMNIRIKFVDFDLESTDSCTGDSLNIYDGFSEDDPLRRILCSNVIPRDILSSGNELYITLNSDFMMTAKGFHLTYESTYDKSQCPNEFQCLNRKCGVRKSAVCDGIDDCGDGSDEENCGYKVITAPKCGQPNIEPVVDRGERIVGGHEAIPGSWPWQVDLQMDLVEPNAHVCGGTLINSQWIVTASHCFIGQTDKRTWRIHLGNHHKFKTDPSEQVRYPERIVIYPDWPEELLKKFRFNPAHDITLIKMNAPVKFTNEVQPVCLPEDTTTVEPGNECYVTGWGETRGSGSSEALKQTKLLIEEGSRCINRLIRYNDTTMICAGIAEGQHGPCHGDSGGPMVCKINNSWKIIGVVSFITETNYIGALCAVRNVPNAFTRVSYWTEWIQEIIKEYN